MRNTEKTVQWKNNAQYTTVEDEFLMKVNYQLGPSEGRAYVMNPAVCVGYYFEKSLFLWNSY